jgi:hypothetical protein
LLWDLFVWISDKPKKFSGYFGAKTNRWNSQDNFNQGGKEYGILCKTHGSVVVFHYGHWDSISWTLFVKRRKYHGTD